jgi:archaellum biogenesis protein FlaJ (TadC family)
VGVGIITMLKKIFAGIDLGGASVGAFASFLHFSANIPLIAFMIIVLLLVHSMASGLMIHMADGGNYFRTYTDLVGMFWVAAIVSVAAQSALEHLL